MRTEENWNNIFRQKLINMYLPPRIVEDFKKYTIEDLESLGQPILSTFLYGKVCSGKTIRAAQLMLLELKTLYLQQTVIDSTPVIFISFSEMLASIKESYGNDKDNTDIIKQYMNVHLLVIDDFLTSRPTEWVIETLYRIINYRYENLKKTIITSNLSLEEIEERLQDQRITSRIDRMCVIEEKQQI